MTISHIWLFSMFKHAISLTMDAITQPSLIGVVKISVWLWPTHQNIQVGQMPLKYHITAGSTNTKMRLWMISINIHRIWKEGSKLFLLFLISFITVMIDILFSFFFREKVQIGHFTMVVNELSNEFGCAGVKYQKNGTRYVSITCNYANTNVIGHKVYTAGDACSKCKSGCDKDYPALCSLNENIDPNAV